MFAHRKSSLQSSVLKLSLLACAAAAAALPAAAQTTGPILKPIPYYIVTHIDTRMCIAPGCGGWFVKAVNQATTRCADGTLKAECHVYDLDTKALGWSDADRDAFLKSFGVGYALVRGTLSQQPILPTSTFKADILTPTEAWVGQAAHAPKGAFVGLKGNGIVCITYPCNSYDETVLNLWLSTKVAGVDLAASGAKPDLIEAGYKALANGGILAAGVNTTITGPAGKGLQFVASEFYLPFVAGTKQ